MNRLDWEKITAWEEFFNTLVDYINIPGPNVMIYYFEPSTTPGCTYTVKGKFTEVNDILELYRNKKDKRLVLINYIPPLEVDKKYNNNIFPFILKKSYSNFIITTDIQFDYGSKDN